MLLAYRDPDFWPRFRENFWAKRQPTVLRQPFREFPFSEAALLRAMQRFQAGMAAGDQRLRYLMDIDGKQAPHRRALKTFLGGEHPTFAEMERGANGRSLGLMINDLQAIDPEIWHGTTGFLRDAHPHVEFPVARTVLDLFYGNYAASFLGLHKDTQEIFAFVVRGEKTILAWPFEYFTRRVPGLDVGARFFQTRLPVDYRKYRKDALVLNAKAGDVIYWPSDQWHIAEGKPGDFSAMLSLGLFLPQMVNAENAASLARFRAKILDPRGGELHSGDVSGEADEARLRWMTGFGFKIGGPAAPGLPTEKQLPARLRQHPSALLLWNVAGKRLEIGANGYSVSLPHSPALTALLNKIALGETVALPPKKSAVPASASVTDWDAQGKLRTRRLSLRGDRARWLLRWLLSIHAIVGA